MKKIFRITNVLIVICSLVYIGFLASVCFGLEQPPLTAKSDTEIPLTYGKKLEGNMSYYVPLLDVPHSGQIIFNIYNNKQYPLNFKNAGYYLFDLYGNVSKCKFNTIYTEILDAQGKPIAFDKDYLEPYICNPNNSIKISCYAPGALTLGESTLIGGYITLKNGEAIGFNYNPSFLGKIITRFKLWWGGALQDSLLDKIKHPKKNQ